MKILNDLPELKKEEKIDWTRFVSSLIACAITCIAGYRMIESNSDLIILFTLNFWIFAWMLFFVDLHYWLSTITYPIYKRIKELRK